MTASAAVGAVLVCLVFAASAAANTYVVNKRGDHAPDGFCLPADCTLREAVLSANTLLGPPDKIVLPSRKPYRLSITGDDDNGFLGDLDIRNDAVRIVHPGRGRATIDANEVGRIFDVYSGATLTKLVLTGGVDDYGGAVRAAGGNVALIRSAVEGNSATSCGGGIHATDDAALRLTRTSVLRNTAGTQAGGVSAGCEGDAGPLTMVRSVVARNRSDLDGPGGGGGYGGGMYLQTGDDTSTIKNSTFARNRNGTTNIGNSGGGLYTDNGVVHVSGSTFSRNRSGGPGGGIVIDGSEPFTMVNSTVSENRTEGTGGGIHVENSDDVSLNAVTIARNHGNTDGLLSEAGGGIFTNDGDVSVRNSLIALNTLGALTVGDPPVKNDCSGSEPFSSLGHNLLSTEFLCDGFDGPKDLVRARAKIGRLDRNGGPTETIALKRRSPAIGKAHKPSAPARDQRRHKRDNNPDIGAFER